MTVFSDPVTYGIHCESYLSGFGQSMDLIRVIFILSLIYLRTYQAVVWEVSHIKKGFLSQSTEPSDEGAWRLKTDGVNIQVIDCSVHSQAIIARTIAR